jgi:hypothetical protein
MRYQVIASSGCSDGTCPTVYAAAELGEDVLVQGYVVDGVEAAALGVPPGETLVRVPRSLLAKVANDSND